MVEVTTTQCSLGPLGGGSRGAQGLEDLGGREGETEGGM